jgi:hypothetical protein
MATMLGVPVTAAAFIPEPETLGDPRRLSVAIDPGARDGKLFVVLEPFTWSGDGMMLHLPAGFRYDGASVPRVGRLLIDRLQLGAMAPAFHDALYQGGGVMAAGWKMPPARLSRAQADALFRRHMDEDGVPRVRAAWAFRAVRWFGGSSWRTA